ncbi:hypothetical protein [Tsukamurella spumae]|uniref:Uncharacterized protein n=1 Tax=Tsukamurella spumae TaxID=44753 RepID=A0A846X0W7_9ACTN|nr:hypothetical protein [Tsukamurella spumae]NKY17600.1 hypothetical protein [Tsukamurella spumae]
MQTLAEQLMAGPRGRALCLELASSASMPVFDALFALRLLHDRTGWQAVESDPRLGLLSERLSSLVQLDANSLQRALSTTVDGAMYWQEPSDDELIAGRPEVAAEIERIAAMVSNARVARWWTDPIAAEQFQVRMEGWRDDLIRPAAAEALPRWAEDTRRLESGAAAEWDPDPRANISAWWPSTPPGFELTATCGAQRGVPTGLYLVEDGFGETRATVHRVGGTGRVLEIDSAAVWAGLCREHPMEVTASKRHDWFRTTGLAGTRWAMPDWASVAREYDAVHLQVGAYLAASGTAIEVEPGVHSVIAGWAPGDTYWLTDVVEVEPEGRVFVKDRDDDLWHAEEGSR